jgi:hypothetical protein
MTDEPVLSVDPLAKHLGGTAVVYMAKSAAVASEWESALPFKFRCRIGMARVYQPGVKFGNVQDARRHRFFTDVQITELTDEEVRKMIIRGIARRATSIIGAGVTSLEDVHAKRRDARLSALRESTDDLKSKDELIDLLEQDNTTMAGQKRDLEAEKTSLQDRIDDLELQVDERDSNVAQQNYLAQKLNDDVITAQAESAELKVQLLNFEELSTLPTSVGEVVDLIAKLYSTRVAFTKRARESTKSRQGSLAPIAWTCLWAIATTLHRLVFMDEPRAMDFQKLFKDATGLDLSLTEGKMTKNDKRIMATRRDIYDGKQIDITPHLKYGIDDPKLLRIHFFIDEPNRRFIVGHCGGHLDTYGTRRR